jgi:signal transduction histidine kinase
MQDGSQVIARPPAPRMNAGAAHFARRGARLSLRRRLAVWMLLSTLFTLGTFAITVQLFVAAEDGRPDASEPADRSDEGAGDAGEEVFKAMLAASPLCAALAVGGALWLSRRALSPLTAITDAARAWTVADLKRSLPLPERVDELHDLTQALNDLLFRLDQGFDALGSFAAATSHELRTPIAVMASQLEVALRRQRSSREWEHVARTSLAELRRLSELIQALLALARATSPPSIEQRAELGECVDLALAGVASEARDAGVLVDVDAPTDDAAIAIDVSGAMLVSVIQELVRNAIRHAAANVTIRYRRDDQQSALVHVDDAGPGIPASQRCAIFEPFVHFAQDAESDETPTKTAGVGLGLAIVKRSVESCGGRVSVGASPAGGARFSITLPAGHQG